MRNVEIDASGQILGRLASRIALTLRGKDTPAYRPDRLAEVQVTVKQASKIRLSGKKADQKVYYNYSGYPGGLKKRSYKVMTEQHPKKILELAVKRMLPDNKLRSRMMQHLTIEL